MDKNSKLFLRKQAEALLQTNQTNLLQSQESLSSNELKKIIHELEVHQIELEMQHDELLRTQNELNISQNRYFDLYDMAPIGYCTLDEKGLIQEANLCASDLLGLSCQRLIKQPLSKFIHREEQDVYYLLNKKAQKTEQKQDGELHMVNAQGISFWANIIVISEKDNNNNQIFRLIFSDISKQKEQNMLVERQKEEFETIFNCSKDGIAIVDLQAKFLNFNDAYLEITGYNREELLQKSCLDFTSFEDKQKVFDAFTYILENGYIKNIEKKWLVNNNKSIFINISISLLPDKKRILLVTKDISSLKLFESQAKLASMGEMIGNIAHQWRQPLSVISTIASGMSFKKELDALNENEITPNMNKIVELTNYLSKTIDDFRDFIKGGGEEDICYLSTLFEKTLSIVNPNLKSNYIKVVTNIDSHITIQGYSNELMQAFINIINNAKDALVANENIEDKYIFIDAKIINNHCNLIIKDNGGGIDQSVISKIFEPYFTTKHQSQGTGLGLSMTYKIITERHNATIKVENIEYEYANKIHKGTLFTIRFMNPLVSASS